GPSMNAQRGPLAFRSTSFSKARALFQKSRTSCSRAGKSTELGTGWYTRRRSSGPMAPHAADAHADADTWQTRPRIGAVTNAIRAGKRAATSFAGGEAA